MASTIAMAWSGPGHCFKTGGYGIFHKDETALLNPPREVLFFQNWGGRAPEPPDETDSRPEATPADFYAARNRLGSWRHADDPVSWLGTAMLLQRSGLRIVPELLREQIMSHSYPSEEPVTTQIAQLLKDNELSGEMREKLVQALAKMKSAVNKARHFAGLPPAETPKVAAADDAYSEWLSRHPAVAPAFRPESGFTRGGRCPASQEPAIKLISDVDVNCQMCGHAFWASFPSGVRHPQQRVHCRCCAELLAGSVEG